MNKRKILIADNEVDLCEVLKSLLDDDLIDCHTVDCGNKAFSILKSEHNYDLLLMDYDMVGSNGLEIAEKLKKQNPKFPVILMSGFTERQVGKDKINSHIDHFVSKPFILSELKTRIFELLKV